MTDETLGNILVMDSGTASVKAMIAGVHEVPLKVPAVLARRKHNRKVQAETRFGMDAYAWHRSVNMNNIEMNMMEEEVDLVYPHIRHPFNYRKNCMYVHKQNFNDQKQLWNYVIQTSENMNKYLKACNVISDLDTHHVVVTNGYENEFDENTGEIVNGICFVEPPPFLRIKNFRQELLSWIFEECKFSFALLLPDNLAALHFFGLNTGLMVDVGELYSRSISVLEGHIDLHSCRNIPIASYAVSSYLDRVLKSRFPIEYFDSVDIEKLKKQICYVSNDFQKDLFLSRVCRGFHVYKLPNGRRINLGADAFMCSEIIFNPAVVLGDFEHEGLGSMAVESIYSSSIDCRKNLLENIVLTGGITDISNFANRLQQEIEMAWMCYSNCDQAKVQVLQNSDAVILGAARYALKQAEHNHHWLSKKSFEEHGVQRLAAIACSYC